MPKSEEPKKPEAPKKPIQIKVVGHTDEPFGDFNIRVIHRVNAVLSFPHEAEYGNRLSQEVPFFVEVDEKEEDKSVDQKLVKSALDYAKSHGYGYKAEDVEIDRKGFVKPKETAKKK